MKRPLFELRDASLTRAGRRVLGSVSAEIEAGATAVEPGPEHAR